MTPSAVQSAENTVMTRLVGAGSRKATTPAGRVADVVRRPPVWAGMAGAMAIAGPQARRAAVRGGACYLSAALLHLPIKAAVGRAHPRGARRHARVGPVTSSFPSGHSASEMAFVLGATQELPALFFPLSAASLAGSWALLRTRSHFPSDLVAGAFLGAAVAAAAWKLCPPERAPKADDTAPASG